MATADRLQFCCGDDDITADFHAETDATEVRVWDTEGLVLVAVGLFDDGSWRYEASDYGLADDWDLDQKFSSWQDAITDFGYGKLLPH